MTGWIETQLGDVITLKRGYDLPKRARHEGLVPVVSSSGPTGLHSEAKADPPGVVTGRYGTLGKVFYVDVPYWPLNTTLYVQDFKGAHARFVAYFLESMSLERYDGAAAVPGLDRNVLHRLPIRWPSRDIQERASAVLAAYDELIESNSRRIEILEEMAQAVYREWFVNFRFPGHEYVTLVDSPLGPIPKVWEVVPVSDAVELNPRLRLPRDQEIRFVPMGSLAEGSMVIEGLETRTGPSGSQFQNGDTLLARITPSLENGKTGFVQLLFDNEVACGSTEFIVMRSRTLTPEFVYLLARTDGFRGVAIKSMVGASGRQRVQESSIASYPFPRPDSSTLQRFHHVVSPMFGMVQNLVEQNGNLRTTRDALLPKLLSGAIDVSALEIETEWLAS